MDDVVVSARVVIPGSELRLSFSRSGGPGGQHVNRTESRVELRWCPGETTVLSEAERARLVTRLGGRLTAGGDLVVTSSRTRDQSRNRVDAAEKLAEIVREALKRPKKRRPTRPTKASKERRLKNKKRRADVKKGRGGDPHSA